MSIYLFIIKRTSKQKIRGFFMQIKNIKNIADYFDIDGSAENVIPLGNGHINDTYLVQTSSGMKYVLQRINTAVFKNPEGLMYNYVQVTEHIKKKIMTMGLDPGRRVLSNIKTKHGKDYFSSDIGFYRMSQYIENTVCLDKVENCTQFYESAVAFGNFQYMLSDFPAEKLIETIPDFHNTKKRWYALKEAIAKDICSRLSSANKEVEFAISRGSFCDKIFDSYKRGDIALKVTHNDTKLNNLLFDKDSGKAICILDLDTIMPGFAVHDFGDSIRFGATYADEDEADLSLVNFDMELYEVYVKGFIEGANGTLSEKEISLLPTAAIMMTLECGMRFLTDYLSGDRYFKIKYENHNLIRAKNQFKLVEDMEEKINEMTRIVNKYGQI